MLDYSKYKLLIYPAKIKFNNDDYDIVINYVTINNIL